MNEKGIVVSIKEASKILDTSKGEVYKLINNNIISSTKENGRTFVSLSEINNIKKKRKILNRVLLKIRNIPFGFIRDVKNPPSKDKYIILYCYGGLSSPAAGERLKAKGYKYIFVWGGITDWPYELVTSK